MKQVKIASSRWNEPKVVSTEATTWGELKEQLGNEVLNYEGSPMKAILRSDAGERNVLVDSSTLLPSGNFSLLLIPEKVKSGNEVVYSVSVLKELKTKLNKLFDSLINYEEEVPSQKEEVIDSLILEAKELEEMERD